MNGLLRHGPWPWLLLAILVVLLLRAPLADRLLPPSARERLLSQASQALAEERLSAADGSGARELFAQVLALDPDHSVARRGMDQVGQLALARAQQALGAGDHRAAQAMLDVARAAGAPGAAIDAVGAQMWAAQASEESLRDLLDGAQRARAEGYLDSGSDSALALYGEVLARDPGNALAMAGRNDVLTTLLAHASARLVADDPSAALALVDRVERIDPGHLGLPMARAALAQSLGAAQSDIGMRIGAVDVALREDSLEGAQAMFDALEHEQSTLAAFADLRARLNAAWARRAVIESIRDRPRAALKARSRIASGTEDLLLAHVDARIALWAQRRAADDVGDAAWKTILRRWPGSFPVAERTAAAAAMRDCFEQGLARIELERAASCLEVQSAVALAADAPVARQRLATAWLGVAEERLGAGQIVAAHNALAAAVAWGAEVEAVARLSARLGNAPAWRLATPQE